MPFETFRRNQRPMLAVFALMAMFAFVVSDSLMNYLGSRPSGVNNDEVIANLHGKDIKASQIGEMANQRAFANDFVTKLLSLKLATAQIGLPVPQTIFGTTDDRSIVDALILEKEADRLGIPINHEATKIWLREAPIQILLQTLGLAGSEVTMRTFRDRIGTIKNEDLDATYQTFFTTRIPDQLLINSIGNQLRLLQVRTLGGGTEVSPLDVYEDFKAEAETVSVNAVAFPVDAYLTQVGEPAEADLKALFEKGSQTEPKRTMAAPAFKIPRRVQIEAISADTTTIVAKLTARMSDEKIKEAYESRKEADFSLPPLAPEERLKLSPLPQDLFAGDAAAKMTPKGTADSQVPPAPSDGPRFRPLDEVKVSLIEELARDQAREEIDLKFSQVREEVMNPFADQILAVEEDNEAARDEGQAGNKPIPTYDSKLLVDSAKKFELTYEKTSLLSQEEATAPDAVLALGAIADARLGTEIGDLGDNFSTEIFSSTFKNFDATAFTTIIGRRYMIWKIADEPARVPTYDEAKPAVVAYWKLEKARGLAEKAAKDFAESVTKKNGDLKVESSTAKRALIVTAPTAKVATGISGMPARENQFAELSEPGKALMDAAFKLSDKQVAVEPNSTTSIYYVMSLGARKTVKPEELYGPTGPFLRLVRSAMADSEMEGRDIWMKELRKKAGLSSDWVPPSERDTKANKKNS
ncbi:MAG: hypothetical protein NT172_19680 [Planctomycetota bacterium]|nr:hypothetical protein [Planctomycetota bacterium]